MSSVPVAYSCPHCKTAITRNESWIDPALYSNPDKAVKKSVFYCTGFRCGKAMGFNLKMAPNRKIEIENAIPLSEIYSPERVFDYNLRNEDEPAEEDLRVDLGEVLEKLEGKDDPL